MSWYSQRDPRWANQRLGTVDGVTIGSDGCYTTAFANMANDCGKDITPAQLDDIFTNNLYVLGDQCTDDMLTKVYSDIVYSGSQYFEGPADLSQLNNDIHIKQIVEIDANLAAPGIQTHFMYFYDYYNGVVRVIDSWTGQLINVADVYGNPVTCIYKIVTYEFDATLKPTPPPAPQPVPTPDPAPVPAPPHVDPQPAPVVPVTPVQSWVTKFIAWLKEVFGL